METKISEYLSLVESFWASFLNINKQLCIACIRTYKYILAPYIPNCCRFKISCSDYTRIQIEQFGVLRGIFNGICRLLVCHPYAKISEIDNNG